MYFIIPLWRKWQKHTEWKNASGHDKPYLFDLPPWAHIQFFDLDSGHLFEAGPSLNIFTIFTKS